MTDENLAEVSHDHIANVIAMEEEDRAFSDAAIEQEIHAKGLTAPRVTLADIEGAIAHECYFNAADPFRFAWLTEDVGPSRDEAQHDHRERQLRVIERLSVQSYSGACANIDANTHIPDALKRLTFCALILRNGFIVTGESACVSAANFDAEEGRKIARQNAIDKCWPLFGFALAAMQHGPLFQVPTGAPVN